MAGKKVIIVGLSFVAGTILLLILIVLICLSLGFFPFGTDSGGVWPISISTYIDTNQNQQQDEGESQLPYVTVFIDDNYIMTDNNGQGSILIPWCRKTCMAGKEIQAIIPPNYEPITPSSVVLQMKQKTVNFGFLSSSETLDYKLAKDWMIAFVNRGIIPEKIDADWAFLKMSIDPRKVEKPHFDFETQGPYFFQFYVFDVIDNINKYANTHIDSVVISLINSEDHFSCVRTYYSWQARAPGDPISNKYCPVPYPNH